MLGRRRRRLAVNETTVCQRLVLVVPSAAFCHSVRPPWLWLETQMYRVRIPVVLVVPSAALYHSDRSPWLWLETQKYRVRILVGADVCHRVLLCYKLFKGLEFAVLSMIPCTMKNPWNHSDLIKLRVSFCRDIAMMVQKAHWLTCIINCRVNTGDIGPVLIQRLLCFYDRY